MTVTRFSDNDCTTSLGDAVSLTAYLLDVANVEYGVCSADGFGEYSGVTAVNVTCSDTIAVDGITFLAK